MQTKSVLACIALILCMGTGTGCVSHTGIDSGSVEILQDDLHLRLAFNDRDREYIQDYYRHYRKQHRKKYGKHMPPGLAKKGHMPPGHQKHLQKHGTLPPGLNRYYLPMDLERNLARLPSGYVRIRVGGDIVLLDENTQVIMDVIYGIDETR